MSNALSLNVKPNTTVSVQPLPSKYTSAAVSGGRNARVGGQRIQFFTTVIMLLFHV